MRINSTSKIKKIIVIKKNRREKGSRAKDLGVNPHSKGLSFSRSTLSLNLKIDPKSVKTPAKLKVKKRFKTIGIVNLLRGSWINLDLLIFKSPA